MASETTTSGANDVTPTRVAAEVLLLVREHAFLSNLAYLEPPDGGGGLAVNIPTVSSTMSLASITTGANEADAQSNSEITTGVATITAAAKMVSVVLSKVLKIGSAAPMLDVAKQEIARAIIANIETALGALLAGGSNYSGTSGVDCTIDDLIAAMAGYKATALEYAAGSIFTLHPVQWGDLAKQAASGTGAGLAPIMSRADVVNYLGNSITPESTALNNRVGELAGVPIFTSTYVPTANGSADRGGALWRPCYNNDRQAAAFGMYMPSPPDVQVYDLRVNAQLAERITGDLLYGVIELRDELVWSVITDA